MANFLNLSDLNGSNGFAIRGSSATLFTGQSVSGADVNADGYADLIVTGQRPLSSEAAVGEVYVVYGKAGGFAPSFDVGSLNGSSGSTAQIAAPDLDVSALGDINADGFDDFIIGSSAVTGSSYVVFGRSGGFGQILDVGTLNGSTGFRIEPIASGGVRLAVSGAGDVNGDGIEDVMVGAAGAGRDAAGESYVIFGKRSGFSINVQPSSLNGINGFKIEGGRSLGFAGAAVGRAGDVNGDGIDDLIVGSSADPSLPGESYLIYGRQGRFSPSLNLADLNGSSGTVIRGSTGFGFSVSSAGDINGDSITDLIVGTPSAGTGNSAEAGAAYVVFGKRGGLGASFDVGSLNGSNGFVLRGSGAAGAGYSVSNIGDFNGDSIRDLLVGAPRAGANRGAAYVVYGKRGGFDAAIDLDNLGDRGFTIRGVGTDDLTGISVSGVGDVNGDHLADVVIGAPNADGGGTDTGAAYVVFGRRADPTLPTLSIADASVMENISGGTSNAFFTITLSAASTAPVTVSYSTADGTATAGSDYAAASSRTLTFAPGETQKTIAVEVNGDTVTEPDEFFSVNLGSATGAAIARGTAIGTILDHPSPGLPPTIAIASGVSLVEGDGGSQTALFQVRLSGASAAEVRVDYATIDSSAIAGSDYVAQSGTLVFAPGETEKTVAVQVRGDTVLEQDEVFVLRLSNGVNGRIDRDRESGVIRNDDSDDELPPNLPTAGDDVLRGTNDGDVINGLAGSDVILGLDGQDTLIGGEGSDSIRGGADRDRLSGGGGSDRIWSGAGSDVVTGGGARDFFALEKGLGVDRITDFQNGMDRLGLTPGMRFGQLDIAQRGNRTVIRINNDSIAVLTGVRADQITAADFTRMAI